MMGIVYMMPTINLFGGRGFGMFLIFFKRKTWCNSGMVCFWVHKFTTDDFVRSIYPKMITIDHGNIKTMGKHSKHRSNDGVFPVASTTSWGTNGDPAEA